MYKMEKKENIDFCTSCRKNTHYHKERKKIKKTIKGEELTFDIISAICDECGSEMSPPGLIDLNIKMIDDQYRDYKGLVFLTEIQILMAHYHIEAAPLSLALGFEEETIKKYLDGQLPTKEHSDIIRAAKDSAFLKEKIKENKDRLLPIEYNTFLDIVENSWDINAALEAGYQAVEKAREYLKEEKERKKDTLC